MTRHRLAVLTLVAGLAFLSGEAGAQDGLRRYNSNPVVISAQIRLALEHEQQAFQLLTSAAGSPEDLQRARKMVRAAYGMIRLAIGGVQRAREVQKFPDPTLEIQERLMEKARYPLRLCLAELERVRGGRIDRLEGAHAQLLESFQTLQSLTPLLP